jgi:hypothetical protein
LRNDVLAEESGTPRNLLCIIIAYSNKATKAFEKQARLGRQDLRDELGTNSKLFGGITNHPMGKST